MTKEESIETAFSKKKGKFNLEVVLLAWPIILKLNNKKSHLNLVFSRFEPKWSFYGKLFRKRWVLSVPVRGNCQLGNSTNMKRGDCIRHITSYVLEEKPFQTKISLFLLCILLFYKYIFSFRYTEFLKTLVCPSEYACLDWGKAKNIITNIKSFNLNT